MLMSCKACVCQLSEQRTRENECNKPADEKNTDSCRERLRISKEPNKILTIPLYEQKKQKDLNGYYLDLEQINNLTIIKKKGIIIMMYHSECPK